MLLGVCSRGRPRKSSEPRLGKLLLLLTAASGLALFTSRVKFALLTASWLVVCIALFTKNVIYAYPWKVHRPGST